MAVPIDNGVVLVTGASSGIGAALARLLGPRARVLVLVARRVERLEALATELGASAVTTQVVVRPCDLGDPEAAAELARAVEAEHGRVDVLINCAGVGDIGLFEVADPDKLQAMLRVNILGLTALTRAIVPGMVGRGRGGLLNVSSGFGLTWMPAFATYAGSKHFVSALTESLRCELAGTGVVVSQLCPGPVATEFEAVAGNPTGQQVPSFIELSAEDCAALALAGFERGRALIVPGFWAWCMISAGRLTPAWILRQVHGLLGRLARRQLPSISSTSD